MSQNLEIFERIATAGGIRVRRGALFAESPLPLPEGVRFSRVEGMMLGLAVGDALGNSTEGMPPDLRRGEYGEVTDYLLHPYWKEKQGYPTDDTQLAFWTLEQVLEDGAFDPARLAARFAQREIFGLGATVQRFLLNYRAGRPWQECGVRSAGNGALMRIAPILIPHLRRPSTGLWVDTALCAMLTHNDSASIASCLALVKLIWELLRMDHAPAPEWWLETFVTTLKDLECDDSYRPRSPAYKDYQGPLWRFLEQQVSAAYKEGRTTLAAANKWYSGAYLLETVPCAIHILMQHGHDAEQAIIRAVNDTWDNDTTAAVVGAAVGALHGSDALPERWVRNLSGRTQRHDDGKVFELLNQARRRWEAPY